MPISIGQILANRYRVDALLGQGGFGAVYRVWDLNLNRPRALKENLDASAEAQRQFNHEASILADLTHPNLPRVFDYFFIPGFGQYLVMDYVEGEDLQSILNRPHGLLPEAQVTGWLSQVGEALAYLHAQHPSVVHRDVKPANIKITPAGKAVLVDFCIAKLFDAALKTTLGAKAVTPGYSPPEQYGQSQTDVRSDVYALGATLYALLTGQEPIESVTRFAGQTLKPPSAFNPKITPRIEAVILRAMKLDPAERYQSAADLSRELSHTPDGRGFRLKSITPRQKVGLGIAFVIGVATWALVLLLSTQSHTGGWTPTAAPSAPAMVAPTETPVLGGAVASPAATSARATSTLRPTLAPTETPTVAIIEPTSARATVTLRPTSTRPTAALSATTTGTSPSCPDNKYWDPVMGKCRGIEDTNPPTNEPPPPEPTRP
jgi:eukaryotic-like serine/threonine-protein kinase